MKGDWWTTGPGRGGWQTDGSNVPWTLINAVVLTVLIAGGAVTVAKGAWHDRTQLELIGGAGVAFTVLAVTMLILVYRWLHPARRTGQVALTAGRRETALTATAVPQVPAAAVPQALPAPTVVVNLVIGGDAATALLNGAQPVVRVVPEAREIQP